MLVFYFIGCKQSNSEDSNPSFSEDSELKVSNKTSIINGRIKFIFCSLTNNQGCTGMTLAKSDKFPTNKPYFFATSHTEQGVETLAQLMIATDTTNKACTIFKSNFGLNPCNLGSFGENQYHIYNRNWHSEDFIAGESDGSKIPYLAFADGTNLEVKVYLAPHGPSEFKPIFYEPKNQDQQYYKICIKDFGKIVPLNGRLIKGFIINNNKKTYFVNKNQLIQSLIEYGFTTKYNDHDPSLIFPLGSNDCP
jgi:hypothetical protein